MAADEVSGTHNDDDARRQRRARDTARWRSRLQRGAQLFKLEAGDWEYDLCIKFAGLREGQTGDKAAVNAALERLLKLALKALLEQHSKKRI